MCVWRVSEHLGHLWWVRCCKKTLLLWFHFSDKLSDLLDSGQATHFADKIYSVYEDYRSSNRHSKHKRRKVGVAVRVSAVNSTLLSHSWNESAPGVMGTCKWRCLPLLKIQNWKCSSFKAWSRSEYSLACFTCCWEFLPCPDLYLPGPFTIIYF